MTAPPNAIAICPKSLHHVWLQNEVPDPMPSTPTRWNDGNQKLLLVLIHSCLQRITHPLALSLRPVYAHIIHKHRLRKTVDWSGPARPVPSNRHVQQNEKRMIKDPGSPGWQIARLFGLVQRAVDIKANCVCLPLDSKKHENSSLNSRSQGRSSR